MHLSAYALAPPAGASTLFAVTKAIVITVLLAAFVPIPANATSGGDLPSVVNVKGKKRHAGRTYHRAEPRHGDRLIGRVDPGRQPTVANNAGAMTVLGIIGLGVGTALAGRGGGGLGGLPAMAGGGGCQVDYATPNPAGCGGNIPSPQARSNGPYRCQGPNGWYVTNTFRSGCYMTSMDRVGTRNSDILSRSVGGD